MPHARVTYRLLHAHMIASAQPRTQLHIMDARGLTRYWRRPSIWSSVILVQFGNKLVATPIGAATPSVAQHANAVCRQHTNYYDCAATDALAPHALDTESCLPPQCSL